MFLAQQRQYLDEIVHHLHRATRDTRGEEKPGAPLPLHRGEKNPHELRRLE